MPTIKLEGVCVVSLKETSKAIIVISPKHKI